MFKITNKHYLKSILVNPARSMGMWAKLKEQPNDPIMGLNEEFKKDTNPNKVLLGMGVYRDNDNQPYVLKCIR